MLNKERALEEFLYASDKERLLEMVKEMAQMASNALSGAVQSLSLGSVAAAQSVIDGDDLIDEMEANIDSECLYSIAMRQPMREDLRFAYAVMKIITDIERVGDQSVNIAQCSLKMLNEDASSNYIAAGKPVIDEILLAHERAQTMLEATVKAFCDEDENAAYKVINENDDFLKIGESAVGGLLSFMNEHNQIDVFTNTLWIVRHIDRVAGHIVNLAERVCFVVTGISPEALKKKQGKILKNSKGG